jgi:hypothetical protein
MPLETIFRASTSRPESVSSRMASFGFRSQELQHLDLFFFSPPRSRR